MRREARDIFRKLPFDLDSVETEIETMADQTLRQLTTPNFEQQPLAVQFPELGDGVNFELKSGLIHLCPNSMGLVVKIQTNIFLNFMQYALA